MKTPKAKSAPTQAAPTIEPSNVTYVPIEDAPKKLFVHVKNPEDHTSLLTLKKTLNDFPGDNEIILVLGAEKKSALRLPFRIDASEMLTQRIGEIYGTDCVVLK